MGYGFFRIMYWFWSEDLEWFLLILYYCSNGIVYFKSVSWGILIVGVWGFLFFVLKMYSFYRVFGFVRVDRVVLRLCF